MQKKSNHIYDYAIIGAGLSGLCIANALNKASSNIVLIEASDTFGGVNRQIKSPVGPINNGLRFMPANDLSMKAVSFLEMLLMTNLSPVVQENSCITFEDGALKPFVGFGENQISFYDEISYFLSQQKLSLSLQPFEWSEILFANYSGDFLPKSVVTKFHADGENIHRLTINGQKTIDALNFIYCGPIKDLGRLLPENSLSTRSKQKLNKNKYTTAICLDLIHNNEISVSTDFHVLNSTSQDDLVPCVGQFSTPIKIDDKCLQLSQWLSFVTDDEAEDPDNIGTALKKMKRQIKRAYPNALENLNFERIFVHPSYSGDGDLKLSSNQTLPQRPNFWLGSSSIHPQKNILGSLLQAELVTAALGFHPLGTVVEKVSTDNLPLQP